MSILHFSLETVGLFFSKVSDALSEDALRAAGMSPEFQLLRQIIVSLFTCCAKNNDNVISGMKETADVLRQILNSPQEISVKIWCTDIVEFVTAQVIRIYTILLNASYKPTIESSN